MREGVGRGVGQERGLRAPHLEVGAHGQRRRVPRYTRRQLEDVFNARRMPDLSRASLRWICAVARNVGACDPWTQHTATAVLGQQYLLDSPLINLGKYNLYMHRCVYQTVHSLLSSTSILRL